MDENVDVAQTQLQKLEALLTEFGVGFERTERRVNGVAQICVTCTKGGAKVIGYNGFSAEFEFDPSGAFIQIGIWD